MNISTPRLTWVALGILLTLFASWPVRAEWTTSGGSDYRNSRAENALGPLTDGGWELPDSKWDLSEFGLSGSQPIALQQGNETVLYHLAGQYLWKMRLDADGNLQEVYAVTGQQLAPEPVIVGVPYSTPTYSPESRFLYFGTDNGRVYGYDTVNDLFSYKEVYNSKRCRFVSSPAVFRINGQDVVVLGDRWDVDPPENPEGECGRVTVVWGLDQKSPVGVNHFPPKDGNAVHAWNTAAAIKNPYAQNGFVIGGYGHDGKLRGLKVIPSNGGFDLQPLDQWKGDIGDIAGSLTTDGINLYWTDLSANLWALDLRTGRKPEGWTRMTIPLAPMVENGRARGAWGFVNTKPALGQQTIYVTLRNYHGTPDESVPGLGTFPGSSGAIVAVNAADGSRKWGEPLENLPHQTYHAVANTDPLVMETAGIILFGDVNGYLRAHDIGTGKPGTLIVNQDCTTASWLTLLKPDEHPGTSTKSYSSSFGVSANPMAAPPVIITGVNIQGGGHRMVALPVQQVYNLAWDGAALPSQHRRLTPEPLTLSPQARPISQNVLLELPPSSFAKAGALAPQNIKVSWFAVDKGQWDGYIQQNQIPSDLKAVYLTQTGLTSNLLTGALTPPTSFPQEVKVAADPKLPPEGYIVGIIDAEQLATHAADPSGQMAARLLGLKGGPTGGCNPVLAEQVRKADPVAPAEPGKMVTFVSALADNYLDTPYVMPSLPDISVTLEVPNTNGQITGDVGVNIPGYLFVHNPTRESVTGPVAAQVTWPDQEKPNIIHYETVTVPPGTIRVPFVFKVRLPDKRVTVQADFNLTPRTFEESNYDNNVASIVLTTDPLTAPPLIAPGEGRVIIVPSDCIPETNPTSGKVCKNYDKTLDDW